MADVASNVVAMASPEQRKFNKTNQAVVGARVIGVTVKKNTDMADTTAGEISTAVPSDPLSSLAARGEIIEPPFDLFTLALLTEHSTELGQCVEAMEVNIDGFGHRIIPRVKTQDTQSDAALQEEIKKERVGLENFFTYACIDDSYMAHRRKLRRDLETTGNAYFEVIRSLSGVIQSFQHIPSYHMRLGRVEEHPVEVNMPILEMQSDGSVKAVKVKRWKRFRKYAQSRATYLRNLSALGGYKTVWFKEFGDPRVYDNANGNMVVDPNELANLPVHQYANELVHLKLYSTRSPYGLPRFIGNLLSIFGDRAAEEINYVTFKNNNIPSMALCVSGGQLTQASVERITSFVESQIQGSDNYSKFLILEAEGAIEGDDGGQVKIDIKPLVKEQHKDALFVNYSEKNQDKIRRSFRLPPIFVGRSDDYTRATADTSRRLADEQVFAPERDAFDDWVNRKLFPDMGIVFHKYKSNSPSTTDNSQLVKILSEAEKTGGMTPRIARAILEEVLNRDLPELPEDFPSDVPFSMTMADAVKNKADPTEPGQQVTALKAAAAVEEAEQETEDITIQAAKVRKRLEASWKAEVTALEDQLNAQGD